MEKKFVGSFINKYFAVMGEQRGNITELKEITKLITSHGKLTW